jgi:hypothetical protein
MNKIINICVRIVRICLYRHHRHNLTIILKIIYAFIFLFASKNAFLL